MRSARRQSTTIQTKFTWGIIPRGPAACLFDSSLSSPASRIDAARDWRGFQGRGRGRGRSGNDHLHPRVAGRTPNGGAVPGAAGVLADEALAVAPGLVDPLRGALLEIGLA